jgi:drug/metabolite transporter (DMT)-like permease
MGIVHTGIAYAMYFGSMDGLKMQTIAVLSYIDPVSALIFSAILLKEPLGITGIIGAVMIIGSAMISEMPTAKES